MNKTAKFEQVFAKAALGKTSTKRRGWHLTSTHSFEASWCEHSSPGSSETITGDLVNCADKINATLTRAGITMYNRLNKLNGRTPFFQQVCLHPTRLTTQAFKCHTWPHLMSPLISNATTAAGSQQLTQYDHPFNVIHAQQEAITPFIQLRLDVNRSRRPLLEYCGREIVSLIYFYH